MNEVSGLTLMWTSPKSVCLRRAYFPGERGDRLGARSTVSRPATSRTARFGDSHRGDVAGPPARCPPYQTFPRRFQGWVRDGTLGRILRSRCWLSKCVVGKLDFDQSFRRRLPRTCERGGPMVGKTRRSLATVLALSGRSGLPGRRQIASGGRDLSERSSPKPRLALHAAAPGAPVGGAASHSPALPPSLRAAPERRVSVLESWRSRAPSRGIAGGAATPPGPTCARCSESGTRHVRCTPSRPKGRLVMDDRAFIRDLEGFHNKRFRFAARRALFGCRDWPSVVAGFRKNQAYRSADAVTPVQPSLQALSGSPASPGSPAGSAPNRAVRAGISAAGGLGADATERSRS